MILREIDWCSNDDCNNNPYYPIVIRNTNFECKIKSSTMGEIRLYAGHYKHTFTTCNRPIVSILRYQPTNTRRWKKNWQVLSHLWFMSANCFVIYVMWFDLCLMFLFIFMFLQTCNVLKGQLKVKCGSIKLKVTENNNIKLNSSKCVNLGLRKFDK